MGIEWTSGEQTHEGAVLAYPVYHHAGGSVNLDHVYARVFEAGAVVDIETGPSSEGCPLVTSVIVDAPDEVRDLAQTQMAQRARRATEIDELVIDFKNLIAIRPGDCVEVYKGRKVKRGTCATVRRISDGEWGLRAQLSTGQWTAVANLRPFREVQEVTKIQQRAAALKVDLATHCTGPLDQVVRTFEQAA